MNAGPSKGVRRRRDGIIPCYGCDPDPGACRRRVSGRPELLEWAFLRTVEAGAAPLPPDDSVEAVGV